MDTSKVGFSILHHSASAATNMAAAPTAPAAPVGRLAPPVDTAVSDSAASAPAVVGVASALSPPALLLLDPPSTVGALPGAVIRPLLLLSPPSTAGTEEDAGTLDPGGVGKLLGIPLMGAKPLGIPLLPPGAALLATEAKPLVG